MNGGNLIDQLKNLGFGNSTSDVKGVDESSSRYSKLGGKTRFQGIMEASKRSFTIESATGITIPNDASMRYISKSPYAAAAKATRRLYQIADKQKKKLKQIRFILRETTQGFGSKTFKYIGVRREYDNPVVVSLNGREVQYKYSYNVKSCIS